MTQIFLSFLFTSVAGSILAIIIAAARPITRRYFSAHWHYYIWLATLIIMIFPLKIHMPEIMIENEQPMTFQTSSDSDNEEYIIPKNENIIYEENTVISSTFRTAGENIKTNIPLISLIWMISTSLIFFGKIFRYFLFQHRLKTHSEEISCPQISMFTKRKILIRENNSIASPLITGIIKPVLLLPKTDITEKQLTNILAHETTHLKRNDILYKWFAEIVKCIHWYNPAIYLICRQIDIDCEISCDMSVAGSMTLKERNEYIETVLSLLKNRKTGSILLTTGMAGKKSILKKRFSYIKNGARPGKTINIISAVIAAIIFLAAVFTSGVLSAEFTNKPSAGISAEMEVTDKGVYIDLSDEILYKNGDFYLPLEDLLIKTGLTGDEHSYFKRDKNKATICITERNNAPKYDVSGEENGVRTLRLQYFYELEIGKKQYVINPEGTLSPERKHLSQIVKTKNAPLEYNNTFYIPYEYIKCMINDVMQTHEITLWDVAPVNELTEENCEKLTYREIQRLQNSVNLNENSWRTDYEEVIKKFLSASGYDVKDGKVLSFSGNNEECKVVFSFNNLIYEFELIKPLDKTENGIWIIKSYHEMKNSRIKKVEFKDKNRNELEHTKNGYAINNGSVASVSLNSDIPDFDGKVPDSVTAYYTPDSQTLEESPLVIGKTEGPFSEIPISVDLHPSGYPSTGNLQIALEYEDKTEVLSESYEVHTEQTSRQKIKSDDRQETFEEEDIVLSYIALTLENTADIKTIEKILNESGTTISKDAKTDLSKNYLLGKCVKKDDVKTTCDENGNITLYFDSDSNDYVDVEFKDCETDDIIASYGVMPDKTKAYSFIGFEKNREYSIEMQAQTNEAVNYLIY